MVEPADPLRPADDALSPQHALVVDPVLVGQGQAAQVEVRPADHLGSAAQPEVEDEGHVHPLIVAGGVLHPEEHVLDVVEELGDVRGALPDVLQLPEVGGRPGPLDPAPLHSAGGGPASRNAQVDPDPGTQAVRRHELDAPARGTNVG